MSEQPQTDMSGAGIRGAVIDIVAGISRIDPDEFEDDVLIREELGIDSLMAMEIVAACERRLGISIDEAQVFCVETVGDFLELLEALYRSQNG